MNYHNVPNERSLILPSLLTNEIISNKQNDNSFQILEEILLRNQRHRKYHLVAHLYMQRTLYVINKLETDVLLMLLEISLYQRIRYRRKLIRVSFYNN